MSNIFEFLGLPADHRKLANKVTQYVKHWDEVPESRKTGKRLVGQVKKDGVCALTVVKDGSATIFSRTGKRFTNVYDLSCRIKEMGLSNGVYMGELTCSDISLEQLSGIVNPNRTNPLDEDRMGIPLTFEMNLFDLITIDQFIAGKCGLDYGVRWRDLCNTIIAHSKGDNGIHVLSYTEFKDEADMYAYFNKHVLHGEEGIVVRDLGADWEAGHKGWRVMKLVRGVDYDLRCIGYEEGTGKYKGKVANLIFEWKGGETIKCMLGKGWTHQDAEDMFYDIVVQNSALSPIGKIFQVYALEESSKGKLRLPKVGEKRFDKEVSDV